LHDPQTGEIRYAGSFEGYKLHGETCYLFNEQGKICCSGKFENGHPVNHNFKVYYKSGNYLYQGNGDSGTLYYDLVRKSTGTVGPDYKASYEHIKTFNHKNFNREKIIKSIINNSPNLFQIPDEFLHFEMMKIQLNSTGKLFVDNLSIFGHSWRAWVGVNKLDPFSPKTQHKVKSNIALKFDESKGRFDIVGMFNHSIYFFGSLEKGVLTDGMLDFSYGNDRIKFDIKNSSAS
jgi:hypothetical protein